MRHSSSRTSADRHANGLGRSVVESIDDTKLMQQSKHSLFQGESQDQLEHVHPYGFVNYPKKPTGSGTLRKAAEAFMSFLGGNRSNGVALVVGDRRYRLYKLAEGEVALHDDQGHQVHIRRDGIYVSAPQSKKIVTQIMDGDQLPQDASDGQIQQAGRASSNNITLDKNGLTINHTGNVTINSSGYYVNASIINLNGTCYFGAPVGQCLHRASKKFSLDDQGNMEIDMLCKTVWLNVETGS